MRFVLAKMFRLMCASCMFFALNAPAQQSTDTNNPASETTVRDPNYGNSTGTIEIVSKFKGPDVQQYMLHLFEKVKSQPSFSLAAKKPPIDRQAKLVVEFSILPNGSLEYTKLVHSSGDPSGDQAIMTAIQTAAPFQALAPESKGKPLKVRWHMVLNPKSTASTNH
jgi:TonB family protein